MTQDLLDRGCELKGKYEYVTKCFRKNLKIMAENNVPAKKAKNLSDEWEAGACTRFQIIDDRPDTSMNLVLETPASGGICIDLTPTPKIKYGPQGLMIHSTGAAQSSAQSNVNTFNEVKTDKGGN